MKTFLLGLMITGISIFALSRMFHLQGGEIGLLALSIGSTVWFLKGFGSEVWNNRVYKKSPLKSGSYPNFLNQTAGLRWTPKNQIITNKEEDNIYIDGFSFSKDVKREFNLLHQIVLNSKKEIYKEPLAFTRGSLTIGSMGSGKTEFINSLLAQKFFNRAVIHDIKGDFVQSSYNRRDIILNPFDRRGKVWDIFKEAEKYPKIIDSFFQTLVSGILGAGEHNNNFFTSSAKDRFVNIFMEIHVSTELTTKEKWDYFIVKIKMYFQEVAMQNQKSEKDVVSTMKLLIEYLEFINYLIQNGVKTFTIQKFLKSTNKKLFLLNNPTYSSFLTPYFSAFLDCFSKIFMAEKEETKKDLTFLVLDEYLSLLPLLSQESKNIFHTLVRSKGGCLFPAIQYLPKNEELKQQILNSAENIYIFQTGDTSTAKEIKEILGEVVYSAENRSKSHNRGSDYQNSYTTSKEFLLTDEILKEIGEDYSHISFTQSNQQLYKGYTKLLKRENKNMPFIEGYYNQFSTEKYTK